LVALPTMAHAMGDGKPLGYVGGFAVFIVFGVAIAVFGDSHHSLISESTKPKERGGVMAFVHTLMILSTIMSAVVMNIVRPEYTPEAMQQLYNLTPFIVITAALLGVVGLEKPLKGEALEKAMELANSVVPQGNPIAAAVAVLKENPQARGFFAFVFISIFSIFLQDNILEVFGAEVFGMGVAETTSFQPMWGGGVLIGMILMGIISVTVNIKKRTITLIGSVGTALGMLLVAFSALTAQESLVTPALIGMGFFTGFFNVGALSMMMDMTIEGATGLYMGMWGMAQAFGNATASLGSGALHTGLIETGLLTPNVAYFGIFTVEAIGMMVGAAIMLRLSVGRFHTLHENKLSGADVTHALEVGAAS
jgi:BCD family chlorophyll transporter-like MFS transporter